MLARSVGLSSAAILVRLGLIFLAEGVEVLLKSPTDAVSDGFLVSRTLSAASDNDEKQERLQNSKLNKNGFTTYLRLFRYSGLMFSGTDVAPQQAYARLAMVGFAMPRIASIVPFHGTMPRASLIDE